MSGCGRLAAFVIALAVCAMCFDSSASATYVSVADGSTPAASALSEWGISFNSNGAVNYSALTSAGTAGFDFLYMKEDTDDTWDHSHTIGPNQGGQDYDGEFLGVGLNGGRLVIAIVTGQRPDNGRDFFSPGDIRITTSAGIFGVEVGGGIGHVDGVGELGAITEGAAGSTYSLNTNGTTKGVLSSDGVNNGNTSGNVNLTQPDGSLTGGGSGPISIAPNQVAGSIWKDSKWIIDPITNPDSVVQLQFVTGTGTRLSQLADYYYSRDALNNQHAVIEVAIDLALFNGATIGKVEWAPSCGNDLLFVQPLSPLSTVPEPGSWLLLSTGGICAFAWRRRRLLRAQAG